ncbi:MAG TPA: hypothetical protein VD973_29505 [Symbiobacteriaceae bacterium]|nr:hypothetical protein [Symbiobacteriaceae bacterium]
MNRSAEGQNPVRTALRRFVEQALAQPTVLSIALLVLAMLIGVGLLLDLVPRFREELQSGSVQMKVQRESGAMVVYPVYGWSAFRTGVPRGGVLRRINGTLVSGLGEREIQDLLKGQTGTIVTLEVERGGRVGTYTIERVNPAGTMDPDRYVLILTLANGGYILLHLVMVIILMSWRNTPARVSGGMALLAQLMPLFGTLAITVRSYTVTAPGTSSHWLISLLLVAGRALPHVAMALFPDWRRPTVYGKAMIAVSVIWAVFHVLPDPINTDMIPRIVYRFIDVGLLVISWGILRSRREDEEARQRKHIVYLLWVAALAIASYFTVYMAIDLSPYMENRYVQALLYVRIGYYVILLLIPFFLLMYGQLSSVIQRTLSAVVFAGIMSMSALVQTLIKSYSDQQSDPATWFFLGLYLASQLMPHINGWFQRYIEKSANRAPDPMALLTDLMNTAGGSGDLGRAAHSTVNRVRETYDPSCIALYKMNQSMQGQGRVLAHSGTGVPDDLTLEPGDLVRLLTGEILTLRSPSPFELLVPVRLPSHRMVGVLALGASQVQFGYSETDKTALRLIASWMALAYGSAEPESQSVRLLSDIGMLERETSPDSYGRYLAESVRALFNAERAAVLIASDGVMQMIAETGITDAADQVAAAAEPDFMPQVSGGPRLGLPLKNHRGNTYGEVAVYGRHRSPTWSNWGGSWRKSWVRGCGNG